MFIFVITNVTAESIFPFSMLDVKDLTYEENPKL